MQTEIHWSKFLYHAPSKKLTYSKTFMQRKGFSSTLLPRAPQVVGLLTHYRQSGQKDKLCPTDTNQQREKDTTGNGQPNLFPGTNQKFCQLRQFKFNIFNQSHTLATYLNEQNSYQLPSISLRYRSSSNRCTILG